jgi:hypothetical protein
MKNIRHTQFSLFISWTQKYFESNCYSLIWESLLILEVNAGHLHIKNDDISHKEGEENEKD